MQAKWVTCISEQKDFFCFQSTMFPAMSSFQIPHLPFNKESWEQSNHSDCSIRYFLRTVIKSSIFYVLLAETCSKYCDLTFTPWPNALAAEINVLLLMHTDKFSTAEHTWISIPPEKKNQKKTLIERPNCFRAFKNLLRYLQDPPACSVEAVAILNECLMLRCLSYSYSTQRHPFKTALTLFWQWWHHIFFSLQYCMTATS